MEERNLGWNASARANAAQRWRAQSAAMGRGLTEAIVAAAQVAPGMDVLDVACGTGEPAISLAAAMNGAGSVIGIDISPSPLEIAKERAAERGLTNVKFQQADAQQLPFAEGSFDRVTCRLGVMFFGDTQRAFAEMRRVLRPGGRIALLAWGPMEQPYFETTIGMVRRVLPELELPASGRAMFKFGDKEKFADDLRHAGFGKLQVEVPRVPWNWPGRPEELWAYFQDVTVPFRPLLEAVPGERRGELDAAVVREIGKYFDGNEVRFEAVITIATAVKET
ncbi:MAG: class I SAM-dependent methyltransferase [Terriglobales bacterium]